MLLAMTQTGDLRDYNPLQLLQMLAGAAKTGVLRVARPGGDFELWLQEGQVTGVKLGPVQGHLALAVLLNDPQGAFTFQEGVRPPQNAQQPPVGVNGLAFRAMKNLPTQPLPFDGPIKLTADRLKSQELQQLGLDADEQRVLEQLQRPLPLTELVSDPEAAALAWRLYRLDLLRERRSRMARVVVTLNRAKAHTALIDEVILQRWEADTGTRPREIIVRNEREKTYTLPVKGQAGLNNQLLLSPPLLLQTGLSVGESLLAKPLG